MKTLVFCGSHPDDESFSVGATLAQYAAAGVKVYYVCATGGEMGTVDPNYLREYDNIQELRAAELKCAAEALGLAGTFYLGYRDSGMPGSADNKHPDALMMASLDEVAGRIVKIIREIRPNVVITHDAGGDYGHSDHVVTHQATVKAFYAAGDARSYPDAGPPFRPDKLYFNVHPFKLLKIFIRLMPLIGQDPRHFGRNKDIDLTKMGKVEYPVHAVVRLKRQSIAARNKAVACHASQSSGRARPMVFRILELVEKIAGARDHFMREYPPPSGPRESDLFGGIS